MYKRQDQPDAAFALAALADEHEHFLPLGGRQQAVTEKFLQGWKMCIRDSIRPFAGLCSECTHARTGKEASTKVD